MEPMRKIKNRTKKSKEGSETLTLKEITPTSQKPEGEEGNGLAGGAWWRTTAHRGRELLRFHGYSELAEGIEQSQTTSLARSCANYRTTVAPR